MSRSNELLATWSQYGVAEDLTDALEGVASYRIRQVRDRVLLSKAFFRELWGIYQGLRVNKPASQQRHGQTRDLFIAITSSSGLAGDIDASIVGRIVTDYNPQVTDVICIGERGASLLRDRGIEPIQSYTQPDIGQPINTEPIAALLPRYRQTFIYYQTFESLTVQRVERMELLLEAQALNQADMTRLDRDNLIIASDYLFEPSEEHVVHYLEHIMLGVALTQMILESQLSQYAARFTTMIAAHERASDARREAFLQYQAARRYERDEATRETRYAMEVVV